LKTTAHLVGHKVDDFIQAFFFIRVYFFLGQLQTFVLASQIDKVLDNPCRTALEKECSTADENQGSVLRSICNNFSKNW